MPIESSAGFNQASSTASALLCARDLGICDYQSVWQRMQSFTDQRGADTPDELWLLQHPPVFTLGKAGLEQHLLNPQHIPVVHCDRGGQVTYHGPGQLVVYTLVDIKRRGLGVKDFVNRLEQCLIDTLSDYGIDSRRQQGAPGVYVSGAKIAALGLRLRRGRTFHGISLNVNMDLEPFTRINPCGYEALPVVQMQDLFTATPELKVSTVNKQLSVGEVGQRFCQRFADEFGYAEMIRT